MTPEAQLSIDNPDVMAELLGERDANIRMLEKRLGEVELFIRGTEVFASGANGSVAIDVIRALVARINNNSVIGEPEIRQAISMVKSDTDPTSVWAAEIMRMSNGKILRPKTSGQLKYVRAVAKNTVTFCTGPAGTGKSYLAVAMAVEALTARRVQRIVLTRPVVEAGERLGFLPGDLMAKVDPYFRPLYDALYDMVESETAQKYFERNVIEVAPLAYMRGRTLNNSFIILDEAQNTSPEQMKMFLTRLGFGSQVVITGDKSQVDLESNKRSGLEGLEQLLGDIEGLEWVSLDSQDVVRHKIVADIVDAYDRAELVNSND